jgi:HAD superfamily hydrolase (TIGR01459 family)
MTPHFRQYDGLSAIAPDYDWFFVDSYGVLHEGVELYPWARHCLEEMRACGKKVYVLTNTPRRAAAVKSELAQVGLTDDLYTDLMSAGETTWRMLARSAGELGKRYYYLGPPRSLSLPEGLPLERVGKLADAQWILIVGVDDRYGDVAGYDEILAEARSISLPAVCANPDRVAIRGGVRGPAAGTLADHYREKFAARVIYYGKPFTDIYTLALEMAGEPDRKRCLCVGDGLYTDILGAQNAGLDELLVVGGIHAEPLGFGVQAADTRLTDLTPLERIAKSEGAALPRRAVARFSW